MNRFGKKGNQGQARAQISSQLALPDWLNGKRLPTLAEVEGYLSSHRQRTADVNKRILKSLMEIVVEQARQDSSQRALITKTERDVQNSSSQEAVYRAEIERLNKEIEESQRYRIKLLKKIEPLEQRLSSVELEEEDQDVMSSSERTIAVRGSQTVHAASSKPDIINHRGNQATLRTVDGKSYFNPGKTLPVPQLSEHLVPIFEQNYILGELSQMYRDKLDILKSSFYDKEVLEHALQRFLQSDCIEYKEYGIEAYEILSLHEKLLDITHSEKLLAFQIESRDSMQLLPQLTAQNIKLTAELQNLKQIYERQRKVGVNKLDPSSPRYPEA